MNSIGKDLATIRKHQGFTLEEMHQKTRIPLEILEKIENDALLDEDGSNRIYARGFIRTYSRTLKIKDENILNSLDQFEIGNYNGLLLESFPELKPQRGSPGKKMESGKNRNAKEGEEKHKEREKPEKQKKKPPVAAAVSQEQQKKETRPKIQNESVRKKPDTPAAGTEGSGKNHPGVDNYNWARVVGRLNNSEKKAPSWLIGVIIIILILLGAIYFIYDSESMDLSSNISATETGDPPAAGDPDPAGLSLDLEDDAAESAEPPAPAVLEDTLYLTLYAAHDKLEPVRVYSDLKPRIDPYWMERGMAFNFEFRDTIHISGQYDRMLLFLNGHRIENFRQNYYNREAEAVELTRDLFENDPEWASPVPLDLPEEVAEPDSIQLRPVF